MRTESASLKPDISTTTPRISDTTSCDVEAFEITGLQVSRRWRWLGYSVLALVLGFGFVAYVKPDMVVMWDTLLTLCGWN